MDEEYVKVCPECGISFESIDPIAHALSHWPEYLDPAKSSTEARKRQRLTFQGGVSPTEFKRIHEVN